MILLKILKDESKVIFDKLQKEIDEKRHADRIEKIRSNKNKMNDRLMSEHLDPLRDHRKYE